MARRQTIAVLSPMHGGSYYGAILTGVKEGAAAGGARIIAIQTLDARRDYAHHDESDFDSQVGMDYIDGFVIIINAVSPAYLDAIRDTGKPVVMISREVPGYDCPVVMPDNRSGARAAVEHLLAHGHKRIGFAGNLVQSDIVERYDEYRRVLTENGIEPDSTLMYSTDSNNEDGATAIAAGVAQLGTTATALFVGTDQNAIAFLSAMADAGYRLPQDLAIVGFDDLDACALTAPPLSSVSQNLNGIGATAAHLVLDLLNGVDVTPGRHLVPASFVARESCGCTSVPSFAAAPRAAVVSGSAGRRERFADALRATLPDDASAVLLLSVEDAARRIADCIEAAAREPIGGSFAALDEAVDLLNRLVPGRRSFIALQSASVAIGRELTDGPARGDAEAVARIDQCVLQVAVSAHEVRMREKHHANRQLRTSLRDEYDLSLDLLRNDEGHPQELEWLGRMHVRAGCVALWADRAPTSVTLEISGSYEPDGARIAFPGERCTVEAFPPQALIDIADSSPADVLFVMPLRTTDADWGMFAVVGPVEKESPTGRETYFQWAALLSAALDHDHTVESLRTQRADLSAAYGRERELVESIRISEERYALAARAANDGLWDWDLAAGTIYYSMRWKDMLGYHDSEIGDDPDEWLSRVHADDLDELTKLFGSADTFEFEHRVRAFDGSYRWVLCRALTVLADDVPTRLVGSLTDVTARRELEERLRHAATYDGLTGLPNRSLLVDTVDAAIARKRRYPECEFAILFLDLDGFKHVNDTLGHAAGDQLLIQVAERLHGQLRATDTAARIGGDEFAVVLSDLTRPETLDLVVGRILRALAEPHIIDGVPLTVTASIGVARSDARYESAEAMIRHSDLAMYRAKTKGRGTAVLYSA